MPSEPLPITPGLVDQLPEGTTEMEIRPVFGSRVAITFRSHGRLLGSTDPVDAVTISGDGKIVYHERSETHTLYFDQEDPQS